MVILGNSLEVLGGIADDLVDLLVTDPPYGIGFMGKDWDKALPDKKIWAECFRVLKDGAFAFVMSIPRSDCLSRMIISLEDAGFNVGFSPIYWAYASGFPKAQNIGKAVDKRLGAEREVIGKRKLTGNAGTSTKLKGGTYTVGTYINTIGAELPLTIPATPQAKALDGSYGGFQPKPAVEVIIVAMKPLSEKTFVDQALKNGKGITWLDEGRIPYIDEQDIGDPDRGKGYPMLDPKKGWNQNKIINEITIGEKGRFPANLSVSDDVLNDGRIIKGGGQHSGQKLTIFGNDAGGIPPHPKLDSGSFSRYFDLDKWWAERIKLLPLSVQKTFPFLIVPKASKSEKNKGCEDLPMGEPPASARSKPAEGRQSPLGKPRSNSHPTVKPLKLMSYLITLGSREGDIILDPFLGSGTTALACQLLNRECIGVEISKEYCEIASKRCAPC